MKRKNSPDLIDWIVVGLIIFAFGFVVHIGKRYVHEYKVERGL